MPVERQRVSVNQFCELLAIEPARLRGVEYDPRQSSVVLVVEPEEDMQTSGTCPQLTKPKGGKKGGGKR